MEDIIVDQTDMISPLQNVTMKVALDAIQAYLSENDLTPVHFGNAAHSIRKTLGVLGKNRTIPYQSLYWQVIVGRHFVNYGKRVKGSAMHFHINTEEKGHKDAIHFTIYNK